ncbi:MAG TPA: glucans biosynthesis glucosyltransferase MdoH [Lacunisphaera sp.]|nr:glucans biosynthesis glucosyltransferase MdoH [Lacunisphaera sp.]
MPTAFQDQFTPERMTRRRVAVLTFVVFVTGVASLLMADLLWGSPLKAWAGLVWLLFTLLFAFVAFGAAHACYGYLVRRRRQRDPCAIGRSLPPGEEATVPLARTAIVMPVYNEPAERIFAGLETIYRSVERTGQLEHFHFFVLSDSTGPDQWVEEELGWARLTSRLGASGRLFYRRRRVNSNKKAGNLADFCRRWGREYRYMVVLDADSIMAGDTIVRLVRLMERNPRAGLIQTAPALARARTLFARTLQFASGMYGPIFQAGLNYWQMGESNYWGHNAIIRLAPFIAHCALPPLPGREPFGGKILSHDFVEAALLRRAGWSVWLAPDLGGSYEELPPTLIDYVGRDRRWCQGNLQHFWLLFARGLHGISRIHFFLGIFAYASSLLWLISLLLGTLLAVGFTRTGLTWLPEPALASLIGHSAHWQAGSLTVLTFILLFLPKVLALADRSCQPDGLAPFGGVGRASIGILLETVVTSLLAPVLMFFHANFVIVTLFGRGVRWTAQRRDGHTTWRDAARAHAGQTIAGIGWLVLLIAYAPALVPWMAPVLAGLLLSIFFSQLTGREGPGQALRRHGLLVTPEERAAPPELRDLETALGTQAAEAPGPTMGRGFFQAVLDPCANALHRALQREHPRQPAGTRRHIQALEEKLLREGPGALRPAERNFLLGDPGAMARLHRAVWTRPRAGLAAVWNQALADIEAASWKDPLPAAATGQLISVPRALFRLAPGGAAGPL